MTENAQSAYARIAATPSLGIDDLKTLVLVEASGQGFYGALADAAPNDAMRRIFARNGQEELAHAHRVRRVIEKVHGEKFDVPAPENNPFYKKPRSLVVSKEMLASLIDGEIGAEALYETWASNIGDPEAAEWLRQNGKEESRHGERVREAIALLEG